MAADAAALLDQLMGRSRNALSSEEVRKDHWSDPDVSLNNMQIVNIKRFFIQRPHIVLVVHLLQPLSL